MNSICKMMAVAAVSMAASLSANAETPAVGGDAAAQKPIPTLHCEFKAMSACTPDGDCKEGTEVAGIKIPVKVTVDFENSVVSAVDETGFARTTSSTASPRPPTSSSCTASTVLSAGSSVHKSTEAASMSFATADFLIGGFGTCSAK